MKFTLYRANCRGEERNSLYPIQEEITDAKSMAYAVRYDHVMAGYQGNHRSSANFEAADCIPEDCDNEHSDNPEDWITADTLAEQFPEVAYVLVYSRNHNKPKGEQTARPRFHVYFPTEAIELVDTYVKQKKRLLSYFPYFDKNAQDAARFLYGTEDPQVVWHEGSKSILEFLDEQKFMFWEATLDKIPEGQRNATLSKFAGRIIKRYGDTDKAAEFFFQRAAKCEPPLTMEELECIWKSAQGFYQKVAADPNYVEPEEYASGFQLMPADNSDVGQAVVLAREYGWCLRYSPSTDFVVYNGSYWEESKPKAQGFSQQLTDRQLAEAEAKMKCVKALLDEQDSGDVVKISLSRRSKTELERLAELSSEQMELYLRYKYAESYKLYAIKRRESKYIGNAMKETRPMLEISQRELDGNEYLLNTPSLTYDLRKGLDGSQVHNPGDFITKQTLVDPDIVRKELWDRALDTFFLDDEALIEYVQRIVGLAAIGKVFIEALIIAYGEGRNGKSTFWNVLARVLGSYSGTMSAETLTIGCRRNVRPELAEAKGKRLLIAAELEEGMRLSTANVKQLCSTDEIAAEKKYKDPFSYTPSHTLVLYTNHLPRVGAMDQGTWRRLIVIPFDAKIEGKSDIKNYADYLFENAGGAILSWIIEGARKVIAADCKISIPPRVQRAIDEYREHNNWLEHFLEECCEIELSYVTKSGEVYDEYRAFCSRTGEYIRSGADFYGAIEAAGFERYRNKKGKFIKGLRLKTEFLTE